MEKGPCVLSSPVRHVPGRRMLEAATAHRHGREYRGRCWHVASPVRLTRATERPVGVGVSLAVMVPRCSPPDNKSILNCSMSKEHARRSEREQFGSETRQFVRATDEPNLPMPFALRGQARQPFSDRPRRRRRGGVVRH